MSNTATAQGKSPAYAWVVLGIVYLLSVTAAMLWFSCPPMANSIIEGYIIGPAVNAAMAASGGAANPEEVIAALNVNADFGMLMTWVAVGTIASALVAIFMQNKIGIKNILIISSAFLVAGGAASSLSGDSYALLCAARVLTGVAVGFVCVSATTAVSIWFANDRRAFAMGFWSTFVPVAMLIEYNIIVPICSASDFHNTWWVITVLAAISLVLCLFGYKLPPSDGQISNQTTSLKEGFKYIKKRQVIAIVLCMLFYNFVSHGFTTFNPTFFTTAVDAGGMGWDEGFANTVASIASASGIIAPIFGILFDRIRFEKKYLLIVVGAIGYVLACIFGFKNLGWAVFGLYMVCMVLANGVMVATLRSMLPMLVGHGGVTAVTVGLGLLTVCEFGGQLFTNFYGMAMDVFGFGTASLVVGVPGALLLVACALLAKPDKELIEIQKHAPQAH